MIQSFRSKETERIWQGTPSKKLPTDIQRTALRKLIALNQAERLSDLRAPPANRLEALRGSRGGWHSIRINDQWRICFIWKDSDAHEVEIIDYH